MACIATCRLANCIFTTHTSYFMHVSLRLKCSPVKINQSYCICQNKELHTIVNISTHVAGYQKSCRAHEAAAIVTIWMHTVLFYHAHIHTCTTKKTQNILESYKKSQSVTDIVIIIFEQHMPKDDNKLKNIISYRIIIRYFVHKTTDSNSRCLLTAEKI